MVRDIGSYSADQNLSLHQEFPIVKLMGSWDMQLYP